jgi:hypothetical protein
LTEPQLRHGGKVSDLDSGMVFFSPAFPMQWCMYRPDCGHFSPVRKNFCSLGASFLVAALDFAIGAVLAIAFGVVFGFVLDAVLGLAFGAVFALGAGFLALFFSGIGIYPSLGVQAIIRFANINRYTPNLFAG